MDRLPASYDDMSKNQAINLDSKITTANRFREIDKKPEEVQTVQSNIYQKIVENLIPE